MKLPVLQITIKQEEEIKSMQIRKEEMKLSSSQIIRPPI
jgi:hypothetical protein